MTTAENTLTPQESLALIAETISKTRDNIKVNSFYFLLWGWLVSLASFGFFILQHYTGFAYYFLPFPVFAIAGVIITISHYTKRKASTSETHISYFLSRMWMVLGICFILVVFINVSQNLPPFTYTLIIAGIGTMVSGLVMKFKPLIIGGIFFLCASMGSVYVIDAFKPLVHGIAIMVGYLIPGYLLKYSKN